MRRANAGPDPLLLLILTSVGLANAAGCSGRSASDHQEASGGDGTMAGTGGASGAMAGTGGAMAGTGGAMGGVGGAMNGMSGVAGTTAEGGGTGGMTAMTGGAAGTMGGFGGGMGGVGGAGAPSQTEGVIGCDNPAVYFGEESGYVSCDGPFYHRVQAGRCPQTPVRQGEPSSASPPACLTDADCAELEDGRCVSVVLGVQTCVSSCETDEDCEPGLACFCGSDANICVPTNCQSDADCGENLLCASYSLQRDLCATGIGIGFACQLPDDGCTATCPAGTTCRFDMASDPMGRDCAAPGGDGSGGCGRPFLVAGTERLAPATSREDWRERELQLPELASLTVLERLALAEHYRAAALMEHASIAAFARFALELLALGAPAELVAETTSAMQDEQRHATTCFALASAFAGAAIGPGPLPVRDCLARVDLESVTLTTFLEGCIGETFAAVEARELALTVADPVLRRTLSGIAEDEARHALLAWGFLKWALERGGPELGERVHAAWRAETERPIDHASRAIGVTPERHLALGLPSPSFRGQVRSQVLHEIVKPCLDVLRHATGSNPEVLDPRAVEHRA
jgi:hypothetical protein